jgi:uncharacterized protein
MTMLDLRSIRIRPGEEHESSHQVDLGPPIVQGGQEYRATPGTVDARLLVARANTGTVYRLRAAARLTGPCVRCLETAEIERDLDLREYQADDPGGVEDLVMPYVTAGQLDLSAWARDALVLSLPDKILCRDDCPGLCPVCGNHLGDEPHEHAGDETDPRWAALRALRADSHAPLDR